MVKKRDCKNCDGTGLVSVDFEYSIICRNCNGNGFQEITEKQRPRYKEEEILNLLHIVSKHTTTQQYEQIISEMNQMKEH